MKRVLFLLSLIALCVLPLQSQNSTESRNPFAEVGIRASVATFSDNPEFHDRNRVVEIGSVLFDTKSGEVVGFTDESKGCISPDVTSMSIDPHCEKYYSVSPYVYALNNPVRFVDPDGRDVKDKVVGFGVGLLTNIIPGTGGLRDRYSPTDPSDYNNALRNVDNAAIVMGGGMIDAGGGGMATGGTIAATGLTVTVASGGTAAIAGVPVVVVGETLAGAGALTAGTGMVLMANGNKNQSEGYDRGKGNNLSTKSINQLNKDIQKGKAPEGITRFDKGTDRPGEQPHVHIGKNALNQDGTWRHGATELTKEQIKYLESNGWKIP